MGDKYKALGDDSRRKILQILSKGDTASGEIARHFKISQPTISNHLKILVEADLLSSKKDKQNRVYSLNKKKIEQVIKELQDLMD